MFGVTIVVIELSTMKVGIFMFGFLVCFRTVVPLNFIGAPEISVGLMSITVRTFVMHSICFGQQRAADSHD